MKLRNIFKSAGLTAAVLLALAAVPSCQEKLPDAETEYTIDTYRKAFNFNFRAGSLRSMVETNAPMWLVQANYSWIHADIVESDSEGLVLEITVDENETGAQRKGAFDLIGADANGNEVIRKTIEVIQNPKSGVVEGAIMFEDPLFEELMIASYDRDADKLLSPEEAEAIIELDLENLGITSVSGIRYFKNLTHLDVNENKLKRLDVSGLDKLESVYFNMNDITSFKCDGCTSLKSVMGRSNNLKTVDLSPLRNSLGLLDLMQNELIKLDLSDMDSLIYAAVGKNSIAELNVSGSDKLSLFYCNDNSLTELDLKDLKELLKFDCSNNYLSTLDFKTNVLLGEANLKGNTTLSSLDLTQCPIIHLNVSNTALSELKLKDPAIIQTLRVSELSVKSLDLKAFAALNTLECNGLGLKELDLTANMNLENLSCHRNELAGLDMTGKDKLKSIDIQENKVKTLDLGDSPLLKNVNVKGNREISLILPKTLEGSMALTLLKDGDCIQTYR